MSLLPHQEVTGETVWLQACDVHAASGVSGGLAPDLNDLATLKALGCVALGSIS